MVSDWNGTGWGKITFDKGYEYSSNVAIANLLKKFINKHDLLDCLKNMDLVKQRVLNCPVN